MGRTLHYSIKKEDDKNFSAVELEAMNLISVKYNSRKFKNVWTCENLWIDPTEYFPNWYSSPEIQKLHKVSSDKAWELVNEIIKTNQKETGSKIKGILKTLKDGYILLHHDDWKNHVHGFVKTQGNEFNSLLVYTGLLELSLLCPKLIIELDDEGEFLLANLKIKNGKVLPKLKDIKEDVDRWSRELAVKELDFKTRFADEYKLLGDDGIDNLSVNGLYSVYAEAYLKKSLQKYARAFRIMKEHFKGDFQLNAHNIEHCIQPELWFDPILFCRAVNVDDFYTYEGGSSKLMDGFDGEYWGLSDKDSEAESYRMIVQVQKLFGSRKITVLPKLGKSEFDKIKELTDRPAEEPKVEASQQAIVEIRIDEPVTEQKVEEQKPE